MLRPETSLAPTADAAPVKSYAARWFGEAGGDLMAWLKLERSFSGITGLVMLLLSVILLAVTGVTWTSVLPIVVSLSVLLIAFTGFFFRAPAKLDKGRQAEIGGLVEGSNALNAAHAAEVERLNVAHQAAIGALGERLDKESKSLTTQHEKHTATLQTEIASLQSELNEFIPKLKFVVERNLQCRVTLRHEEYLFDPPDGEPKEVDYYVINANVKIHFENDAAITLTLRQRMWVSLFRRTGRGKEKEIPLDPEKESLLMLAGEGSDVTPKLEDFVFEPLKPTKSYALFFGMGISTRYGKRLNRNCFIRLTMDAMGQLPCYVDLDVDWEAAQTEKGTTMTPRTSARCQAHK